MSKNNTVFIQEIGKVEAVKGKTVYVRVQKKKECNGCKACGFGSRQSLLLPSDSEVDCQVGDTVSVMIPQQNGIKTSLFLWVLPILLLIVGATVGFYAGGSDVYTLLGAGVGLILGVFLWFLTEKIAKKSGFLPVVFAVQTKTEEDETGCEVTE